MCDNDKDPTIEAWKVFWCGVVLLGAIWCVYDWYSSRYCKDVAVPTLCSYQN